jgi:hypothetical protein
LPAKRSVRDTDLV